jgi:uncharacterized protein involved in exopolysaccharide biosynthesis
MKRRVSLSALCLGLLLAGCHFGMYSATTEIQLSPKKDTPVANEIGIMESPNILSPVVSDLKLDQTWAKRLNSGTPTLTMPQALEHFQKVLKIEAVPGTNIVKITAYSEVPEEAAQISNAVADRYTTFRQGFWKTTSEQVSGDLTNEIAQLKQRLEADQAVAKENPSNPDNTQRIQREQKLLDELNANLKSGAANQTPQETTVRIISRAEAPAD